MSLPQYGHFIFCSAFLFPPFVFTPFYYTIFFYLQLLNCTTSLLNDEFNDKISGGKGKNWTEEEENYLFRIAQNYYTPHYEGYNWESIAQKLNSIYHNDRTATACRTRFYQKHGDERIDLV